MKREIWRDPPDDWRLDSNALHIWAFSLDRTAVEQERFWSVLSSDEQARARRFYFEKDRHHFVTARGILRHLLGRYLSLPPNKIRLVYGEQSKPALDASHRRNGRMLHFNLSHSSGMGLTAFAWDTVLGIDIERVRPLSDGPDIAKHYFSAAENDIFVRLPSTIQSEAFFNCWTRKEAFIKAIGDGLTYPLDRFDVAFVPGEAARLLCVEGSSQKAARWRLIALDPEPGYAAALVAESGAWQPVLYRWPAAVS